MTPTPTLTVTSTTTPTLTLVPATALLPAMDFDCNVDPAVKTLSCNWKDARGLTGSLLLKRDSSP